MRGKSLAKNDRWTVDKGFRAVKMRNEVLDMLRSR